MNCNDNYWDNVPTECFFDSNKSERIPKPGYEDIGDAAADINDYIDK